MPKRTRYHHGNVPGASIDAALQILKTQSAEAITLRELARRIGVSQTAPYRHFRSRAELLASVAAEGFRMLRAKTAQAAHQSANASDRVRLLGLAYVGFAVENAHLFRLMFGPELGDRSEHVALLSEANELLVELGRALHPDDLVDPLAKDEAASTQSLAAWSTLHGLASLLIDCQLVAAGYGPEQATQVVELVTRALEPCVCAQ